MAPTTSKTILIIEDDRKTASLVALYLEKEGFRTLQAHDGVHGLALARAEQPAMVILDLMLPKLDGWEVCRQLRSQSDVPLLMLTARGEEADRVSGLTMGADDYVVKPFSPRELVARVRAILRRRPATADQPVLSCRELTLDPEKRRLLKNRVPVPLTPHEYALVSALMAAPGKTFTRDELKARIYPDGDVAVIDRVVDVHIGKLRQKIEQDPANPEYVLTVRGIGYRFVD